MTQHFTTTQAMNALAAARPDPELIDQAWDEQRAESVFRGIPADLPAPVKTGRRWALSAAAVALVVGAGLFAQSSAPSGTIGAPPPANALDRLAQVTQTTPIPAGSYLQETVKYESIDHGATFTSSTNRWVANDGWVWEASVNSQAPYKTFEKSPLLADDPAAMALLPEKLPSDPSLVKQQMFDRYAALMKHSNRNTGQVVDHRAPSMLAAIYGRLSDPRTAQADRVVLLRTLPLIDGLTIIENTTDPGNRPALAARVAYHWEMDNVDLVGSIYFDPANGDPLAYAERTAQGSLWRQQVITDRHIVTALPEKIVKVLGTKRVNKAVGFGG